MAVYLMAHDLGTTGNKATLFSVDGTLVAHTVYPYPTRYFNSTWAEQDPRNWWKAVCETSRRLLEQVPAGDIAAVAFSGQMMGCVCLGKRGELLRDGIIWADQRAVQQAQNLEKDISQQEFYRITGHRISASYSLEKLMWVKDHEPDVFSKLGKCLNPKDYVVYQLTGELATDYSDASGTNAFDLNRMCWSTDILRLAGVDEKFFPEVFPSTHIAGRVTERAAAQCGLLAGTPVILGGGDGVCAAVGAGSVKENSAYAYLGSSSWIAYSSHQPVYDPQMRTFNWAHIVPGYFAPTGTMQAAGNSLSFMKNNLCKDLIEAVCQTGGDVYEAMDREIEMSSCGAGGLLYLPYLLGERSPRWSPEARAAFIGLKMEHQRKDLLRATVEGIAMNLEIIFKVFRQHADIENIHLIGGLAKGKIVAQILTDVLGCNTMRMNYLEEATSIGAAVTAGVGVGALKNFESVEHFVQAQEALSPQPEAQRQYEKLKPIFDEAYFALQSVYRRVASLQ